MVESSQSSTATMRGSVSCTMQLSRRKSPWTMAAPESAGQAAGSQAISWSIAATVSVCEARYCSLQRLTWRAM